MKSTTKRSRAKVSAPSLSVVLWPESQPDQVRSSLLDWHARRGRHDLPWTTTSATPHRDYRVALSEIMLQQTTVATGLKRYPLWLTRFPTWESLAAAAPDEVMKAWEGLGYYARARALHAMAKKIVADHHGVVPVGRADRLALPGVGPSTASALGSFLYAAREPIWDANVNRIWRRWWGDRWPADQTPAQERSWVWEMAQSAMPTKGTDVPAWTQAVMDLGATVCTAKLPNCAACPWRATCRGHELLRPEDFGGSTTTTKVKDVELVWVLIRNAQGVMAVCPPQPSGVWSGLYGLPLRPLPLAPEALDSSTHPSPDQAAAARSSDESGAPADHALLPPIATLVLASGTHRLSHRRIAWRIEDAGIMENNEILKTKWQQIFGSPVPDTVVWLPVDQAVQRAWPKPIRMWWDSVAGQSWMTATIPPSD
jgi:A/G-specific adenine glycosylase